MTCTFAWCAASNHFHCRNDTPPAERICEHVGEGEQCTACYPPAGSTTAEALATVRAELNREGWESTPGLDALALLGRRMQDTPPLSVLVEGFCLEVEAAEASRGAKERGGQYVPAHGPFGHLQPSARSALNRWAEQFREALETKPEDVL